MLDKPDFIEVFAAYSTARPVAISTKWLADRINAKWERRALPGANGWIPTSAQSISKGEWIVGMTGDNEQARMMETAYLIVKNETQTLVRSPGECSTAFVAFSTADFWVACQDGFAHWDGVSWKTTPHDMAKSIVAFWHDEHDRIWAVGKHGLIMVYERTFPATDFHSISVRVKPESVYEVIKTISASRDDELLRNIVLYADISKVQYRFLVKNPGRFEGREIRLTGTILSFQPQGKITALASISFVPGLPPSQVIFNINGDFRPGQRVEVIGLVMNNKISYGPDMPVERPLISAAGLQKPGTIQRLRRINVAMERRYRKKP